MRNINIKPFMMQQSIRTNTLGTYDEILALE